MQFILDEKLVYNCSLLAIIYNFPHTTGFSRFLHIWEFSFVKTIYSHTHNTYEFICYQFYFAHPPPPIFYSVTLQHSFSHFVYLVCYLFSLHRMQICNFSYPYVLFMCINLRRQSFFSLTGKSIVFHCISTFVSFKVQLTPKSFFRLTYSPYWPDHLCEKNVAVAFFNFFS